jgi:hypothetical protein
VVPGDPDAPAALGRTQPDAGDPQVSGLVDVVDPAAQPGHRAWQFVREDQQFARTDQALLRSSGVVQDQVGLVDPPPAHQFRE